MSSLTYGNGLIQTTAYDQRFRISSISNDGIQNLSYTHNNIGNITGIANNLDPTKNKTYAYDAVNRLTTANGPWSALQYNYDLDGNRTIETAGPDVTNYTYSAISSSQAPALNRLPSIMTATAIL